MTEPRVLYIDHGKEAPFHSGFSVFAIEQLAEDAGRDDAPPGIRRDWYAIADWLGSPGDGLRDEDKLRIEDAWKAYIGMGVAPSERLQPVFEQFATELAGTPASRPPTEILYVFDRLLATDEEIKQKRAADVQLERERMQKVFAELKPRQRPRTTKQTNRDLRRVVFFSATWMAGVFLYAWLFDPLHVGGWDELQDDDFARLWVISLLPLIGALLYKAYRRIVGS